MATTKYIGIYGGKINANPSMTVPEIFANQIQWDTLEDIRHRRAGTGRVIFVLAMHYDDDDNLVNTSLIGV